METQSAYLVFFQFASQAPIFLVWVIGFLIALRVRAQFPRKAKLALWAFGILIVSRLIRTVFAIFIPMTYSSESAGSMALMIGISNLFGITFEVAAWILILMALFKNESSDLLERVN